MDYISRTGRLVRFRWAQPEDLPLLRALFADLSEESRRLRFLAATREVSETVLIGMLESRGVGGRSLLSFDEATDHLLAVAQYVPSGRGSAEVAFAVEDDAHGEGIATEMLRRLATHAMEDGLFELTGLVLAENHDMLNVFTESGWPISMECSAGVYRVTLALTESPHGCG